MFVYLYKDTRTSLLGEVYRELWMTPCQMPVPWIRLPCRHFHVLFPTFLRLWPMPITKFNPFRYGFTILTLHYLIAQFKPSSTSCQNFFLIWWNNLTLFCQITLYMKQKLKPGKDQKCAVLLWMLWNQQHISIREWID